MIKIFRRLVTYVAPLTILGIFLFHSYNVQSELAKSEPQEYISLKELSEIAQEKGNYELSFLDKISITIFDWIVPGRFINKGESLKVLDKTQADVNSH
jgi:hypothetical protein